MPADRSNQFWNSACKTLQVVKILNKRFSALSNDNLAGPSSSASSLILALAAGAAHHMAWMVLCKFGAATNRQKNWHSSSCLNYYFYLGDLRYKKIAFLVTLDKIILHFRWLEIERNLIALQWLIYLTNCSDFPCQYLEKILLFVQAPLKFTLISQLQNKTNWSTCCFLLTADCKSPDSTRW